MQQERKKAEKRKPIEEELDALVKKNKLHNVLETDKARMQQDCNSTVDRAEATHNMSLVA